MASNIKINILTGFFGSGKTTLINYLVKDPQIDKQVAIIQNEYSDGKKNKIEMGIEKELLTDGEGNTLGNLYELPNGCICCVVKDNVVIFLENLVKTKQNIQLIIVEAHGMADISTANNYLYS